MARSIVRIESIEINDYKNVKHGCIDLVNSKSNARASVIGLYGQNGSGKTTLIDCISLLKEILLGSPISNRHFECINVEKDSTSVHYSISIKESDEQIYNVNYQVTLSKKEETKRDNLNNEKVEFVYFISNETLSFSKKVNGETKISMYPWIKTSDEEIGPQTKLDIITGKDKEACTDVIVAKKLAFKERKSFLFSKEFSDVVSKNCKDLDFKNVYSKIRIYGITSLFVFDNKNTAHANLDDLPLLFRFENSNGGECGQISIPLGNVCSVPMGLVVIIDRTIENMNVVLKKLIPGLEINLVRLGEELLEDGTNGVKVQFVSLRQEKAIPLRYESDGIKKIIAILQLLIVVYNNPSVTIAIDELDSGIFEYLLGELLNILSNKGKGQLIFTSHNLRPLETIDKNCVFFTTIKPDDRYSKIPNIKPNNNLRDVYYHSIMLGEKSDIFYDKTNNYEIAIALKEAGDTGSL